MLTRHHDLVIIGTGSGNSVIGPELDGLDIGLVEKDTFGGTCLNVGCIPTKMFVLPADRVVDAREDARLDVRAERVTADWAAVRDRVFGRIDLISAGGEVYRESADDLTLYRAAARFVGPVALDTGTGVTVTADRWVIAAGGRPRLLDVPGLDRVDPARGVHTNETIMRAATVPPRLAIVGGGFIAAEFAHVLDAFGSTVTWVHRGGRLLEHEDEDITDAFTALARQRWDVRFRTTVTSAVYDQDGWLLGLSDAQGDPAGELTVDAMLVAAGRVPNTDLLDVEAAGLATHPDGRLVVDAQQRASVEGVFGLGDISSDYQLKHVANHEARIVSHNLAHPDAMISSDHRFVPHAVFTHPQIAAVGRTEQQLREAGTPYAAYVQHMRDVAYGWALEDATGLCKVLIDPASRQLLGAHLMGPQASSLVQPLIQAASFGQPVDEVARGQYWIHPALTEVVENALLGLPGQY